MSERSGLGPSRYLVGATILAVICGGAPSITDAQTSELSLVLRDQAFAIDAGQRWTAEFTVDGDVADLIAPASTTTTTPTTTTATDAVDAPRTSVRIVAHRVIDEREELAAALDGALPTAVDRVTLPASLEGGADGATLAITVPTTPDVGVTGALTLRRPGLYPVTVELVVDDEAVAQHLTFIERLPVDGVNGSPMSLAIAAAALDPGPAPSPAEIDDGREQLAQIAELADAVDGPITVQVPPVLLDALDEDERALDELRSAVGGDEVLAIPANVLDPSSAVAIDAQEDFVRELRRGEDLLTEALPESLPQRATWLVPSPISTDAAAMLADLGFRSLVLAPDIYTELDGNIGGYHDSTLTLDVDLDGRGSLPASIVDPRSALLDRAELERRGTAPADAAVRIVAELVTTRRELGSGLARSAVLVTPPGMIADPDVAGAVARYATSMPDFRLTPLSAVPSSTDPMVVGDDGTETVSLPATAGPDLSTRAQRIDLTRVAAAATGSMLPDESDQDEQWQAELNMLLSTGITDEEAGTELDRVSAEMDEVRAHVEAPRPFTFTLTGRSSPLRWNLRNNGDESLEVVVRASSPKLTFPEGDQPVVLPPGVVTEVVIPVEARTLGTSAIGIEVLTPALDQRVIDPVVLTARVNALTGLGQVVTGAAIVVLLSWWFTHFRRRRRRRLAAIAALEAVEERGHELSPDAAEVVAVPDRQEAGHG